MRVGVSAKSKRGGSGAAKRRWAPRVAALEDRGETVALAREFERHHETGPAASGGDLDADWRRAQSSGEETVGGSVATPDQNMVDEIGRALGVEQRPDAPVMTSEEILRARDRHYWHLERGAAAKEREP